MLLRRILCRQALLLVAATLLFATSTGESQAETQLDWTQLPDLPSELGVAGPFAGISNDALIVAGGANFPRPVWESNKQWVDAIHVLVRTSDGYSWKEGGTLPRPTAYGASVSTKLGVLCLGGNDTEDVFAEAYFLKWNGQKIETIACAPLPQPTVYAQAAMIGDTVYVACGQSKPELTSATSSLWSLDLSQPGSPQDFQWKELPPLPGPTRAFAMVAAQHDGFHDAIYVMGGRRDANGQTEFLTDVWQFVPKTNTWHQRKDAPRAMMAGEAIGVGQSHIFVLASADESNWGKEDQLRDNHPGFPQEAFAYHTITDSWARIGETPACPVTTTAVRWGDSVILPSGEVRPRVRSPHIWKITASTPAKSFGVLNYLVLFGYLLAMVGIGVYFTQKNKNTDDYFRGGKQIPWWAAGCSIFATMLSSLTFTGLPSKAFAQDWVYAVSNFTIPVVAILAVYVALPFYRRIDATSAYEYLEMRFGRLTRMFASMSFVFFHLFRMAIVMSLTALALAVATPLTPVQSVLLMGVLSIVYCTMGGIEAVIWTDTIQTFVLLGGAILALVLLIGGVDGGFAGFWDIAQSADKFNMVNSNWDVTNAQVALWVILAGAVAQNISSYTADQAVVQRYVTTSTEQLAARSIWMSAILTIPATILFFGIGTALFAFYQSQPGKLDPLITTDQIFPLFIAREIPVGLAGLIVAGVFAAAQSTVSTSMNSSATTIIVDFLRPLRFCTTERGYLYAARTCTFLVGTIGTLLALLFVNPDIRSLFDAFIMILGIFMGILGGLFLLGAFTRRTNQLGALCGALFGAAAMLALWKFTRVNSFVYPAAGLTVCFVVGYVASLFTGGAPPNLAGLTIYDAPSSDDERAMPTTTSQTN
ncbi:sodium:solute symporter [Blastopirellula marina]|uniref:Sodium:solute symporter n=1 Tax=Blastopirellula marina TaxID=124 RepID=A0A2S8EYL0_9BACT|nr:MULTISPECIES: sodium/solute symporter [Pirellulaceae]PQO24982.1 sodium:solute symporter [Blastopirellula marina]RCS40834.1 sodium:solute symporter [Bremerella cremea]